MLGKLKIALKKVTNRPKIGTLRVKWLKELEQEKDLGVLTRFKERYTKGYPLTRQNSSTRYR